ncbi:MAG: GNAT family N-acetyltransferase [Ruminiclostridium sp.]|nr:GNAT family N-acetyltransferase [Ruminiclostridium sp.]
MNIEVRKYTDRDIPKMTEIWNEIVEEGIAFPQENLLDYESARDFFGSQSYTGVAEDEKGNILGLYILHPNNIGRCGHISNASYAVASYERGKHIGEKLVLNCISKAKELGFGILQFNAVVATNIHARHLYERIGFKQLGTITKGFRMKDGHYEDICPYYIEL